MQNKTELKALKTRLNAFLKNNADIPQPLAEAMERVVCAVDFVLMNPKHPELTDKVFREELAKFEDARKAAPSGRRG